MYKRNVLTSYATSLLGRKLIALSEDEGGASCATDSIAKGDFQPEYHIIAQLSYKQTMNEIIHIFAQKILFNLMGSTESDEPELLKLVDQSLNIFHQFLTSTVTSSHMTSIDQVRELAKSHIASFSIFKKSSQLK